MYCRNCGKECDDKAVICIHCGCLTGNNDGKKIFEEDAPSVLFVLIGFLLPLVGFILFLAYLNTAPKKAKSAGHGALLGFFTWLFLAFLIPTIFLLSI